MKKILPIKRFKNALNGYFNANFLDFKRVIVVIIFVFFQQNWLAITQLSQIKCNLIYDGMKNAYLARGDSFSFRKCE